MTLWLLYFHEQISAPIAGGSEITSADNTPKLALKVLERLFSSKANSETS